jgi:hypothetical protein
MDTLHGLLLASLVLRLHLRLVLACAEARRVVARMTVGDAARVRRDLAVGKGLQRLLIIVGGVRESHPSAVTPLPLPPEPFRCSGFAYRRPAPRPYRRKGRVAHSRRSAQAPRVLLQPRPRGLVGAEAYDPLQILGRDSVAARRDLENRAELYLKRFLRLLDQRARGQRRLVTAVGTFEQSAAALFPDPRALAVRAAGRAAPVGLDPLGAAVGFG